MKIKRIPFILVLFFLGCGDWGHVIISSDYEPELNIFGFLTQEQGESFVIVSRTAKLNEDLYSYDYLNYYNNESDNINIYDAEVYIINENNDSIKFEFTNDLFNSNFQFRYKNNQFIPSPRSHYKLYVNTPLGLNATGELITPSMPELTIHGQIDTLTINESFTMSWQNTETPVGISFYDVDTHFESNFCLDREEQYYIDGEIMDTFDLDLCDYIEEYLIDDQYLGTVKIQLSNYDKNYFDYFILNNDDEFLNFITGQPGTTAKSFGINGGLGVFGSFFTSTELKFVKND